MMLDPQLRLATWAELLPRYSEAHRHYHNSQHIEECLREFEAVSELANDPVSVELAILFHDAIYDPHRSDNEEQSAQLAIASLTDNCPPATVRAIKDMILATKHNAVPVDPDSQLLVDIDLAILGQDWERFDQYEDQIRSEFLFVPEKAFREKRGEILEGFLSRSQIYQTEFFCDRYETAARENLARSLQRLRV